MKKHIISLLVLFILLGTSYIGTAKDRDTDASKILNEEGLVNHQWPMYSHDVKHTGLSSYSTEENPLTEKWRFLLDWDTYYAGFIIDSNGIIYGGGQTLFAINPNGTMKWSYNPGRPIESTPALDENGIIYFGTIWGQPNYLHAIYSNNGTQKWNYYVGNDIDSSPAVGLDGTIYFGDWSGKIHAVNPDGTQKWIYQTGDVITSSPAIGDDGTIYIGSHDKYVYALNPNGTLQWRFQTEAWVHSSPTIGPDGTIYIGSDDSYLYALNPENGTIIWRCHLNGGTWCSPTRGNDGVLYLGTYDMKFHAVYPNGTIKWTYNAPGRIWFGSSASVSSDGTIYFGTTTQDGGSGALVALNPDGTERFKNTYGYYATSPAIGEDGTVYAASFNYEAINGHLHAFGRGPLQADAGGPYSTYAGEPFTVSEDIYGGVPPYTCHWDFGDGNTSNERHPTHTYSVEGNYTITFTVTDDEDNISVDMTTITVTYGPPDVYFEKPEYGVYVFDRKIRSSTSPKYLIFGRITLIVNASHPVAEIDRVEFHIDGKLRATDTTSPYSFIWRQPYLFNWIHAIRVVAISTVSTVAERQCVMVKFL